VGAEKREAVALLIGEKKYPSCDLRIGYPDSRVVKLKVTPFFPVSLRSAWILAVYSTHA
jgi:hypothetical protein